MNLNLSEGGFDLIDEEIGEEMDKINWWKLSEREAQSLGVSIGILNDAASVVKETNQALIRSRYLLIAIGFLCAAGLLFHLPAAVIVIGINASLWIDIIIKRIQRRMAISMEKTQRTALFDEIKKLVSDYPSVPLSIKDIKVTETVDDQKLEL